VPFIEPLESRIAPATIYVTTLSDHEHPGKTTLRDAIYQANGSSSPATISFGSATKSLKGVITLTSALPSITYSVTINGAGITISGANHFQDLSVTGGAAVSINGLKLTGGNNPMGGGLYLYDQGGEVTLTNCVITGNHAVGTKGKTGPGSSAQGGGIDIQGGTVYLTGCGVTKNTASGGAGGIRGNQGGDAQGGGIMNAGDLSISKSHITGNTVTGGAGGAAYNYSYSVAAHAPIYATAGGAGGSALGGGIFNLGGTLNVTTSVISGNTARGGLGAVGGKASNGLNGANFKVVDGMVTGPASGGNGGYGQAGGNGGSARGGGISSISGPPTLTMSTISGNSVTAGSGGAGSAGGHGGNGGKGGHFQTYSYTTAYGGSGGNGGNGGNAGIARGGGVYCNDSLTVSTSTLSGNIVTGAKSGAAGVGGTHGSGTGTPGNGTAGAVGMAYVGSGGGIGSNNGTIMLSLSTVTGNSATDGGGVYIYQDASATIENSTIAFNKGTSGGGLFVTLDAGNDPVNVMSAIISQNSAPTSPDVGGAIAASNSLIGVSAMLGKLGFHDGNTFTETLLPSASGPAVSGGLADGFTTDQNGKPFGAAIFIGAVQTTT